MGEQWVRVNQGEVVEGKIKTATGRGRLLFVIIRQCVFNVLQAF